MAYSGSLRRAKDDPALGFHLNLIDLAQLLLPFYELGLAWIVGYLATV